MTDIYALAGGYIRAARIRNGLTQEDLADRAGTDVRHLRHVERGTKEARLGVYVRLLEELGVPVKAMLGREPTKTASPSSPLVRCERIMRRRAGSWSLLLEIARRLPSDATAGRTVSGRRRPGTLRG